MNFQQIPIEDLTPSPFWNRRYADKEKLGELTGNVKDGGIIEPLIVRPQDGTGKYEIAAGWRRWKAGKAAGLKVLPCIVRKMKDEEFLGITLRENLLREDLPPLDEAEAFRVTCDNLAGSAETIAAQTGKSLSYVYQRLKLLDLTEKSKQALIDGKITVGHAILIARLPGAGDQQKALEYALNFPPAYGMIAVKELARFIESQIYLNLITAPFNKSDDKLTDAVACTVCPKRTGFSPALFPDIAKKETCTDPVCFYKKCEAHLKVRVAEAKIKSEPLVQIMTDPAAKTKKDTLGVKEYRELEVDDKACDATSPAIIADGPRLGREVQVCLDKSCGKHWVQKEKSSDKQKEERRRVAFEHKVRLAMLDELLTKSPAEAEPAELRLIAVQGFRSMSFDLQKVIFQRHRFGKEKPATPVELERHILNYLEKAKESTLVRFLLEISLLPLTELTNSKDTMGREIIWRVAKGYGVDTAKLEKGIKEAEKEAK